MLVVGLWPTFAVPMIGVASAFVSYLGNCCLLATSCGPSVSLVHWVLALASLPHFHFHFLRWVWGGSEVGLRWV